MRWWSITMTTVVMLMIMVMMTMKRIRIFASLSVILFPRAGRTKQQSIKRSCWLRHSCSGGHRTTTPNDDNYREQGIRFQRILTCVTSCALFHCSMRKLLLPSLVYWWKCFPGGSDGKALPAVRETWVRSLSWEDPLEKEMATHSSILAWKIPCTEEPGGLQSHGIAKSQTRLSDFTYR